MTVLDYILIGILGFFALIGLFRGLVNQLFSLVGLVAGFILAKVFYGTVMTNLGFHFFLAEIVSFVLIFVSVLLCAKAIGFLVEKVMKLAKLSLFNRVCGLLLGLIKGFALCALVITIMLLVYPEGEKFVRSSPVAGYFFRAGGAIYRIIPDDIKGEFKNEGPEVRDEKELPPSIHDGKNHQNRF